MKIKDLIERLQQHDPETIVIVNGYEEGYDEIENLITISIAKNLNKRDRWWSGEFIDAKDNQGVPAVLLPRKS